MTKREVIGNTITITNEKGEHLFYMTEEVDNDCFKMSIGGKIQNDSACEFGDEINAIISINKNKQLHSGIVFKSFIFDLSQVNYISNVALHIFLEIQNKIDTFDDAQMIIMFPSEIVLEKLRETGYIDILDIRL